ncbi:MAG: protein-tyrosine-phosphatase [Phaeodactylibacter sp.]|nr:protein-tyrosine-phosphatase [Phaeodactylibacter sp.]
MSKANLFEALRQYLSTLPAGFSHIPEPRKAILRSLADYIRKQKGGAQIVVICTHNSRRSHMGQLWAAAAATWYGVEGLKAFSGGTEATAFHPNAVAALKRAGFQITRKTPGKNPVYEARYGEDEPAIEVFSKRFDDDANPGRGYAAIMVCSEADEACPFVPGAALRLSLPFEDPKRADGTPEEEQAYDEACRLIAREFCFAMQEAAGGE